MSALFKRLVKVQTEGDATTLSGSEFHMLIYTMTMYTSNIYSITRRFTQLFGTTALAESANFKKLSQSRSTNYDRHYSTETSKCRLKFRFFSTYFGSILLQL